MICIVYHRFGGGMAHLQPRSVSRLFVVFGGVAKVVVGGQRRREEGGEGGREHRHRWWWCGEE
jgi:hypothetical protein